MTKGKEMSIAACGAEYAVPDAETVHCTLPAGHVTSETDVHESADGRMWSALL